MVEAVGRADALATGLVLAEAGLSIPSPGVADLDEQFRLHRANGSLRPQPAISALAKIEDTAHEKDGAGGLVTQKIEEGTGRVDP